MNKIKTYGVCLQVKESVGVPVVANGDIRCEEDVKRVRAETGVDGKSPPLYSTCSK